MGGAAPVRAPDGTVSVGVPPHTHGSSHAGATPFVRLFRPRPAAIDKCGSKDLGGHPCFSWSILVRARVRHTSAGKGVLCAVVKRVNDALATPPVFRRIGDERNRTPGLPGFHRRTIPGRNSHDGGFVPERMLQDLRTMMIIRGQVVCNPYYVEPEPLLEQLRLRQ